MPISECVNGCVTNDRLGLVRLANLTVTKVRQRMAREQLGHRGRKGDLAWAHRMLLLPATGCLHAPCGGSITCSPATTPPGRSVRPRYSG